MTQEVPGPRGPGPTPYVGPPDLPPGASPDHVPELSDDGSPPAPPHRRPRTAPVVVGVLGAVLIVVAALALPNLLNRSTAGTPTVTGTRTGVTIEGLRLYPGLPSDHTRRDVDYAQTPPAGGMHDPVWLACGVYDAPVRDENAVHDLEHGSIWISYDPAVSEADVAVLVAVLPDNAIMAPYPGLDAPVVLTAWGRQLSVDGVDDPRVTSFIEQFGGGEAALEPFVGCQGGTRDPQGRTGSQA